jgi:hypothetical protein
LRRQLDAEAALLIRSRFAAQFAKRRLDAFAGVCSAEDPQRLIALQHHVRRERVVEAELRGEWGEAKG